MYTPLQRFIDLLPEGTGKPRTLSRDEFLFRQQAPARAIYSVVSGRVRLFRDLPDGSSVILYVARSGDTCAEAALFTTQYHCHARAEVDTQVIGLDTEVLMRHISADAAMGVELSRLFAAQVRELRAMLTLRGIRSADERLLAWLRLKASGERMAVELDRPWTGISEELGLTREAVYRSLARLQEKGLIDRRGRNEKGGGELICLRRRS
ncbi:MAG: Crp/Fnr family transcriptional regulator [Pseudomonadota bacterium]